MNFKPGDEVYVIPEKAFSDQSRKCSGTIVTIEEIILHGTVDQYYCSVENRGGGIWLNEVRHLTKLEKALR